MTDPNDAQEKLRQRKEKLEKWKRQRELAKSAQSGTSEGDLTAALKVIAAKPPTTNSVLKLTHKRPGASFGKVGQTKVRRVLGEGGDADAPAGNSRFDRHMQSLQAENEAGAEPEAASEEAQVDPLDAFMEDVNETVKVLDQLDATRETEINNAAAAKLNENDGEAGSEAFRDSDEGEGDVEAVGDDPSDILAYAAKQLAAKKKDLANVDHSKVAYESFRKDFYVEPVEMARMTKEEVEELRLDYDGIKVRGMNCPKPAKTWTQCGLPSGTNSVIKKLRFEAPTSIQAQAIPAVMSGRDIIGVAKTGSGKTIAFLLPMFRHIMDQRSLEAMEGPIALIMTPTRELAVQIFRDCRLFLKALNLRAVCAYGGAPIKDQIAELKRGAEIVVCTPGRMIDLLCANSGRVTNLRRVTFLVLDEADRMFDMGFEPQVMKIVNNVRPDRQTILFSATFPRQMEALARKVVRKPLEIVVGARSTVGTDITQIVEVREESSKFVRLLEILGQFFNNDPETKVLIFVDRQDSADNLLKELLRRGYPCMSLHGGKDQHDRDTTIADFKSSVVQILGCNVGSRARSRCEEVVARDQL